MKRLFVTDLDETLLSAGALPPLVAPLFRQIVDRGTPIVLATARGVRAATDSLGDAVPHWPLIALNGSVLSDPRTGAIMVESIAPDLVRSVSQLGTRIGTVPCLLGTDGRRDKVMVSARRDPFTEWSLYEAMYFKAHDIIVSEMFDIGLDAQIVRIVFCTTVRLMEELVHLLNDNYPMLSTVVVRSRDKPGHAWLEVGSSAGTKLHAVRRVAKILGCRMSNVVYYGDGANDIPVMGAVGEAVAVANADPEVRKIAHRTIGPAASGSVVLDLVDKLDSTSL